MKTIRELLEGVTILGERGNLDAHIVSIEYDSRRVAPSAFFVAIKGFNEDGAKYIKEAIARGAAAIIFEGEESEVENIKGDVAVIATDNARRSLATLSVNFYNNPSKKLKVIGITGTNGKTTTSFIIDSILSASGKKNGVIGTISYRFLGEEVESMRTTPEAPDLQKIFSAMVEAGVEYCAMEVSSHSLFLDRVYGTNFDVGVFMNLTQDHLDFHGDEKEYFEAKLKLFTECGIKHAVVNIDDPYGKDICTRSSAEIITVGIETKGDIYAEDIEMSIEGLKFKMKTPIGEAEIRSKLIGLHNVYNILCAAGSATTLGIPITGISKGIEKLECVPGRFEKIDMGQNFTVVVDYAHTDDALDKVIRSARKLTDKRVIVLFGCGGNRDKDKRIKMGEVVAKLSDYAIITTDNPRNEDPSFIIEGIEEGVIGKMAGDSYKSIVDREEAIEYAMTIAKEGDIVILAGKGHEKYQIIGDRYIDFDDCEVADRMIKKVLNSNK